jgi:hypothetical protein
MIRLRRRIWLFLKYVGRSDYPDASFRMTPRRAWQVAGLILDMAAVMRRI